MKEPSRSDLTDKDLEGLLAPYIYAAHTAISLLVERGYTPIVWGGHAASWVDPKDQVNMPTFGTPELRNRLSRIWHESMHKYSARNNFHFFSMIPLTLKRDYTCDTNYLADEVHIKFEAVAGYFLSFLELNELLS